MSTPLLDTYAQFPFELTRGEDVWVWDTAGNRYLDLYGGHAVAILGHSPRAVSEAVAAQSAELLFYSNLAPMAVRDRAARALASFVPEPLAHIFFCNSGAEANENALKLALKLTGRERFVSLKGAFHGRTLLASAVTDNAAWHSDCGGWIGERVSFIEPNNPSRLEAIDERTAAVIVEPIQSMAGVTVLERSFMAALRERCDETGALLIFDEIQTGMGRTGVPFVSHHCGTTPDMTTLAKGLGSGVPVAAMLLHERHAPRIKSGDLGSTFGAGPIAMAAVAATVAEIERAGLVRRAGAFGSYLAERCGSVGAEFRGAGCLAGLRFEFPVTELHAALLESKIITGTSKDPHVLRLLPPLTVTEEHADMLVESISTFVRMKK